jgi:hypothetical protein
MKLNPTLDEFEIKFIFSKLAHELKKAYVTKILA